MGYRLSENSLGEAIQEELATLAKFQSQLIVEAFSQIENILINLANNRNLGQQMLAFDQAIAAIERTERSPTDYLQNAYITNNPNQENGRYKLIRAIGQHDYHKVHEQAHSWLYQIIKNNDLEDLFLINTSGMIVYSVKKSLDFAVSLKDESWRDTNLARFPSGGAFMRKPEIIILEDFEAYPKAGTTSGAFMAKPLIFGNQFIGALVLHISEQKIHNLLAQFEVAGNDSKFLLVGSDYKIRGGINVQQNAVLHPITF